MSKPSSLVSKSGAVSPSTGAEGFLLLSIEHALVKQYFQEEELTLAKGQFRQVVLVLECVSLPIPPEIGKQTANPFISSPSDPPVPTHDFWLVLHVGPTFELLVTPGQMFQIHIDGNGVTYALASREVPGASILFTIPHPKASSDIENLELFESWLQQYGSLHIGDTTVTNLTITQPPDNSSVMIAPEELRGKLVLVNEENGEIIGEMDQRLSIEEDKRIVNEEKYKPVVLDFEQLREGQEALRAKVKTIPEAELKDWLLKGANSISRGILSFGAWSSHQMLSSADRYVKSTAPQPEPATISSQARRNLMKVRNASLKTATVTKSTLKNVDEVIQNIAGKTYEHGFQKKTKSHQKDTRPLPPHSQQQASQSISSSVPYTSQRQQFASTVQQNPGHLSPSCQSPVPPRSSSSSNQGRAIAVPSNIQMAYAQNQPPSYNEAVGLAESSEGQSTSKLEPKKRALLGRILLAGEVILTSLEATAHDLINNGTTAASTVAGHKFGRDAGEATALFGDSVKNVVVVYIDVLGTGRRAILKSTAKGVIKARLKNGEQIELQAEGHGQEVRAGEVRKRDDGSIVVGMTDVAPKERSASPAKR
nr:hypothetical protein L203_02806 [Cryptococcus depauperatus CBS 7841]